MAYGVHEFNRVYMQCTFRYFNMQLSIPSLMHSSTLKKRPQCIYTQDRLRPSKNAVLRNENIKLQILNLKFNIWFCTKIRKINFHIAFEIKDQKEKIK